MFRASLIALALTAAVQANAQTAPTSDAQILLKQLSGDIAPGMEREVRVIKSSLPPAQSTPWHTHPYPVTILVTEGTIVIEMEGRQSKTLKAGEAWLEPVNVRMRGTNPSDSEMLSGYLFQVSDPEVPFLHPAHD
jgi:quercetin dioxygenase-like cupin family protein